MEKINMYTYCSAKEYLHALFLFNKEQKKMTIKKFSQELGFNSHGFIIDVFGGKKNLSDESIEKIAEILKFKVRELKYLLLASEYDKEQSPKVKQDILQKLLTLRLKVTSTPLTVDQIDYYMKWYNAIIRELVVTSDWGGDYKKLAQLVEPEIKEKEAEESVALLLKLGLIKKEKDSFVFNNDAIYATENLRSAAIYWLKDMVGKAQNAVDRFTTKERYVTSTTALMSEKKYIKIQEHFDTINSLLFEEEEGGEIQVYQIGLQMFPVSKKFEGK